MNTPDLNLLPTLEALLAEGSVAGAARRLRLSPSAMSRALARLRQATDDPLLVRAGRGLVPSPRALELREHIGTLVQQAQAALRPARRIDLRRLQRSFTLRTSDGFVETFGPTLLARIVDKAPGVTLRFVPKLDRDSAPLRDGRIDLETGVVGPSLGPELRTQALFRDRFVGVVRPGHALTRGAMTAQRYAEARHVRVARREPERTGPVDEALAALGLASRVATVVSGFSAALALARGSDLVATVPARHTAGLCHGLRSFELPLPLASISVALLWHPRMDGDAAHRWLRGCVQAACAEVAGTAGSDETAG